MTINVKLCGLLLAALLLAGCQSTQHSGSTSELSEWFHGKTVGYFMGRNPHFTPVASNSINRNEQQLIFETEPALVTTTLPAHMPAGRKYNNASMGRAFNNLNAAVGTVPAVSRTTLHQCRVAMDAQYSGSGDRKSPDNWRIVKATFSGKC